MSRVSLYAVLKKIYIVKHCLTMFVIFFVCLFFNALLGLLPVLIAHPHSEKVTAKFLQNVFCLLQQKFHISAFDVAITR